MNANALLPCNPSGYAAVHLIGKPILTGNRFQGKNTIESSKGTILLRIGVGKMNR